MKKIVIVAGDSSGDLYGGFLSKKLKERYSLVEIYSFGGSKLAQYSQQIIDLLSYSVCGLIEVLSSLKKLLGIFKQVLESIERIKPDLIILIDFPDFNLRLAKTLNRKYPIFYYVSPQVWAWRKKRINLINKYINKMVVIFKFEENFYKQQGIEVLYFGHPLLEIIETSDIESKKVISFLPGSRRNEIKRHLPIMKETKRILEQELSDYAFRIIKPFNLEEKYYRKFWSDIDIVNHSYEALKESKFIITSSGTATVEIAVVGIPYLIIYKINPLSWQILKRMVNTEFIGMINILTSQEIVKELLQRDAKPRKIAQIACTYLKNEIKYNQLKENLKKVKDILSPYGATDKFAAFIGKYLGLDVN